MSILKTVATGQLRNLTILTRKTLHSEKIVWCVVASFGAIGPYFFEDEAGRAVTVNSACYTHDVTHISGSGVADTWWWNPDSLVSARRGNGSHCGSSTRRSQLTWYRKVEILNGLQYRRMSTPATSSSGVIKRAKVHEKKPRTTVGLKRNIRVEVAFSRSMLQWVMQNFQKHLRECIDNKGRQLTDTIFRKCIL